MERKENISKETKLAEAISRMEYLELNPDAILKFKDEGTIPLSLGPDDEIYGIRRSSVDRLTHFEEKHHALVYYVIFIATTFGDMESYLFVSDYEEEWESDWDDIHEGYAMTWTENLTHPSCSEFGSISFTRTKNGGLRRIG